MASVEEGCGWTSLVGWLYPPTSTRGLCGGAGGETRREQVAVAGLFLPVLIQVSEASKDFIFKPHLPGCEEALFIKAREKSIFRLTRLTYFMFDTSI